jgi:CRISPR-associated protein Cas1
MSWRSILVTRPARLHREHFSLAIEQDETVFVPFADIAVIVLDHPQITITHPVLTACGEYGIGLFSTDATHTPNGVFLSFVTHSRATRVMRLQLNATLPMKKRIWMQIVKTKIRNQAISLTLGSREGAERLAKLVSAVKSGDPDNLEARAARWYFARLFGDTFSRMEVTPVNACLNYGYAIIRGAIARQLVLHGLHPPMGIFHDNEQNAFNLADDLIEPFRPVVDLFVVRHLQGILKADAIPKASLVSLLNVDIDMPEGKMAVATAIEYAVESLVRVLEGKDSMLSLPELMPLREHFRET